MPGIHDVTLRIVRAPTQNREFEDATLTDMARVTVTFDIAFLERELANPAPWTGSVRLIGEGRRGAEDEGLPFIWQEARLLEGQFPPLFFFQNVETFSVAPSETPFQRQLNGLMRQLDLDVDHNDIRNPLGGGRIRIDLEDRIFARVVIERGDTVLFGESEPVIEFFEQRRNRRIPGST